MVPKITQTHGSFWLTDPQQEFRTSTPRCPRPQWSASPPARAFRADPGRRLFEGNMGKIGKSWENAQIGVGCGQKNATTPLVHLESKYINLSIYQPINLPINQSIYLSINLLTYWPIDLLYNLWILIICVYVCVYVCVCLRVRVPVWAYCVSLCVHNIYIS